MKITDEEFNRCMAVLITGVGKPMTADQIDIWREFFSDMTFNELKRGIMNCLRDYKYAGFPPVGLIRQAAGVSGGVTDADSSAVLAWDKVLKAIRHEGAYKSIQWDDPAIQPAIETAAGSWPQLCEQNSDQLNNWTRKAFLEAYKAHRTARTDNDGVSTGLIAADAGRIGFESPEPVRLGQEQSAAYGFGREHVPALTDDGAAPLRITEELALRLPVIEDEPEPEPMETPEEFESRKRATMHALNVRFSDQFQPQPSEQA